MVKLPDSPRDAAPTQFTPPPAAAPRRAGRAAAKGAGLSGAQGAAGKTDSARDMYGADAAPTGKQRAKGSPNDAARLLAPPLRALEAERAATATALRQAHAALTASAGKTGKVDRVLTRETQRLEAKLTQIDGLLAPGRALLAGNFSTDAVRQGALAFARARLGAAQEGLVHGFRGGRVSPAVKAEVAAARQALVDLVGDQSGPKA